MLNGLSLFSGIGGIDLALGEWVRPVAYCEIEPYCQGVLLSRMRDGQLPTAPIWDDVSSLRGDRLPPIDIIYGGFPCQDISVAGAGKGLGGERSGLYFEIERLISEARPTFVFLENVPAIRTRGLARVIWGLSALGYDLRWTVVSAAEVGAPHLRKRWFMLAHASQFGHSWRGGGLRGGSDREGEGCHSGGICEAISDAERNGLEGSFDTHPGEGASDLRRRSSDQGDEDEYVANSDGSGRDAAGAIITGKVQRVRAFDPLARSGWWTTEPDVGRVAHGVPDRMDRIRALGNAVVPAQAREAFMRLSGLKGDE